MKGSAGNVANIASISNISWLSAVIVQRIKLPFLDLELRVEEICTSRVLLATIFFNAARVDKFAMNTPLPVSVLYA